ncbi:MAG: ribokinase [Acidobacteriota bacterium]|nr:ribokinase [Acidobacteriota bacterium]
MHEQRPVLVVGSVNMDLVTRAAHIPAAGETIAGTDFATFAGGKGANQAVAVGRLGYPVQMVGRVGEDAFGLALREGLREMGVNAAAVRVTPGPSGVASIVVAENGENCIVIVAGANGQLSPEDMDAEAERIAGAGMVLAQLEVPLPTVERLAVLCERSGVPLVLDPAPVCALPESLLRRVTWLTPNETEAAGLVGHGEPEQVAERLLALGPQGVVLKLGARGAYLRTQAGYALRVPAFAATPLDTTAAGDAFNGAFATALLLGRELGAAARFAAAAAAISVTRAGAQSSMASMAEVESMLANEERV